jgi:hypothetical protein
MNTDESEREKKDRRPQFAATAGACMGCNELVLSPFCQPDTHMTHGTRWRKQDSVRGEGGRERCGDAETITKEVAKRLCSELLLCMSCDFARKVLPVWTSFLFSDSIKVCLFVQIFLIFSPFSDTNTVTDSSETEFGLRLAEDRKTDNRLCMRNTTRTAATAAATAVGTAVCSK